MTRYCTMHGNVIGKITAKWCGYCVKMEDEWNKFVNTKVKGTKYTVKELDSETESQDIASINKHYGVKLQRNKYPTIFSINDGVLEYYYGDRTVDGFSSMIKDNVKDNSVHKGGSRYRRRNRRTRAAGGSRRRRTSRKKN